jgi:hypothetical protein
MWPTMGSHEPQCQVRSAWGSDLVCVCLAFATLTNDRLLTWLAFVAGRPFQPRARQVLHKACADEL